MVAPGVCTVSVRGGGGQGSTGVDVTEAGKARAVIVGRPGEDRRLPSVATKREMCCMATGIYRAYQTQRSLPIHYR